ncbi:hypothetical protein QJS10_CPA01g01021 [Acorus calamus]|uniref:Gnk2-homologous domain-containing protein n=1 Tax=Acorus calamus TaxID=4465 RepID=A0AAV9FNG1_ACOCL|nr:hypothetical protein QJS10_CPA01g01021 [Acorus calamus]
MTEPNLFNENLSSLLSEVSQTVSANVSRFSVGATKYEEFFNIYAMGQCMEDLLEGDCYNCLSLPSPPPSPSPSIVVSSPTPTLTNRTTGEGNGMTKRSGSVVYVVLSVDSNKLGEGGFGPVYKDFKPSWISLGVPSRVSPSLVTD